MKMLYKVIFNPVGYVFRTSDIEELCWLIVSNYNVPSFSLYVNDKIITKKKFTDIVAHEINDNFRLYFDVYKILLPNEFKTRKQWLTKHISIS